PGKTYVVEFWATWCGPCKVSIPHLTKLQKQYKDVQFVGVSIWESDQSLVKPFVAQQGDNMDYTVCMDSVPEGDKRGSNGLTAKAWMAPAGRNGIPSAFIVKDGKIAWIGHPMQMDEPLGKVVAGTWDVKAARTAYTEQMATELKLRAVSKGIQEAQLAKDDAKVIELIDAATKEDPALESNFASLKFAALVRTGKNAEAVALAQKVTATATARQAGLLNAIASQGASPNAAPEVKKAALAAAEKSVALTNGTMQMNGLAILARAQFANGDAKGAEASMLRAIEAAKTIPGIDEKFRTQYIQMYEKQLQGMKNPGA
ncbi:MAG TPA: TlpA disulfide reductase family protein, partial [Armatimonadaceae bacterium]|nr:TlpA disulfide reductase family protein [Armatimonadaceae bacterium]